MVRLRRCRPHSVEQLGPVPAQTAVGLGPHQQIDLAEAVPLSE